MFSRGKEFLKENRKMKEISMASEAQLFNIKIERKLVLLGQEFFERE
jgi:hypothetical protein